MVANEPPNRPTGVLIASQMNTSFISWFAIVSSGEKLLIHLFSFKFISALFEVYLAAL
jgi:hypothetical protein